MCRIENLGFMVQHRIVLNLWARGIESKFTWVHITWYMAKELRFQLLKPSSKCHSKENLAIPDGEYSYMSESDIIVKKKCINVQKKSILVSHLWNTKGKNRMKKGKHESRRNAVFNHSSLARSTGHASLMTDSFLHPNDLEEIDSAGEHVESSNTPKKRQKSGRDALRHSAPLSDQSLHRKSKSSRDMRPSGSSPSKKAPLTSSKKHSKSRRPVATILGHQFRLYDSSSSHDVQNEYKPLQLDHHIRNASLDIEEDYSSHLSPIPILGLREESDAFKPGTSAPELMSRHLHQALEPSVASATDIESDQDRMTILQLKTRRDRYLRTVSLSPAVPASVQEDLDLMQSQSDVDSSEDDDEEDEEDGHVSARLRRTTSFEQVIAPVGEGASAGTSSSSLENQGYLHSRLSSSSSSGLDRTRKRVLSSTQPSESSGGQLPVVGTAAKKGNKLVGPTLASLRSTGAVIKEGPISKKGRRGGWKRKYLVLDERRLYMFEKSKTPNKPAKQVILLSFAQCKASSDPTKHPRLWVFDIFTAEKKYIFATPTSAETDAWVAQIHQICEVSMLDTLETSDHLKRTLSNGDQSTRTYNKEVLSIRDFPGNNVCCDCSSTSPEWAVINLGIFVCIDCSGIHRSLGVQISKVRSLTLDRWEYAHINTMRNVGNSTHNSIWEHSVPPYRTKPAATAPFEERKYWIHSKYIKRSFFDTSKFDDHPIVHQTQPPSHHEDLEVLKPAIIELIQHDRAFRQHVRSLLLSDD
jgi:hypothetical protein